MRIHQHSNRSNLGRILTAMLICALILLLYLFLLVGCAFLIGSDAVVCFQFMYFRGAVGIPSAIIASISIVALLAAGVGGEFKIKLWGLSLEGPSAPITMWIVCFLSITLALYSLFSGRAKKGFCKKDRGSSDIRVKICRAEMRAGSCNRR
jgi:hypothetical protein